MTQRRGRRPSAALAAVALVALEPFVRVLVGKSYLGATPLLVAACGLVLLPFLPRELDSLSIRLAVVPALGLASFSALLTTASILGIPLDSVSITLVVAGFVVPAALVSVTRRMTRRDDEVTPHTRELLTLLALAGIVAFALASSWDIAYPFQPSGTDWGHYLLYADEVADQGDLLIDDPFAGEDGRVFADPAAVGAIYGSFRLLDGISSWSLTIGIVVLSAVAVLSVYAAAAVMWGTGPGLVAAGAYAVAPIRLDLMYWHGLGTTLALVFVPLLVLSLGLLFRGARGWRHILLLTLGLIGVAAAHTTSAIVVAAMVVVAPLVDVTARLLRGRRGWRAALYDWWGKGVVKPLIYAVGAMFVLGAGVIGHVWLQSRALGRPVSWRLLGPDWLDRAAIAHYYSVPFLVVSLVAVALVLTSRRLRHDPALLAVASLALACVAVSQLWRVRVSFDYQRVVYYLGVGLALLIGAAFLRRRADAFWIAAFVVAFVVIARTSVGLRLPERILQSEPRAPGVTGLIAFREKLDRGMLPDSGRLVSDACLHFAVPYLVRRATMPAFSARQVGFVDRLPLARQAATILAGGPAGAALAARVGVRYVVADPRCVPDLEQRLGGTTVVANDGVVVVQLRAGVEAHAAGASGSSVAERSQRAGNPLSLDTSLRGRRPCRSPSWSPANLPAS